jgi:hypothetical protein
MQEKPSVTVSNSGVSSVKAGDIIRSRVGQEELRKTRDAKIYGVRNGRFIEKGPGKWVKKK